jgi:hypothetical protein
MGMDVYGKNPIALAGEYFRRNVWGWRPLADLCLDLAPEECAACTYWQSNDGDGLGADGARALAAKLEACLANGSIDRYVAERNARLAGLPDETCTICKGTGVRSDQVGREMRQPERRITEPGHPRCGQVGWCNGCDGRGTNRPSATCYDVDRADAQEFIAFLNACGGFEIC